MSSSIAGNKPKFFSKPNVPAKVVVHGKSQTITKTETKNIREKKSEKTEHGYSSSGKFETSRKDTFKKTYQSGSQDWDKAGKPTKGLEGLAGKGLAKIGNKELASGSIEKEAVYKQASGSFKKGSENFHVSGEGQVKVGVAYAGASGTVGIKGGKLVAQGEVHAGATLIEASGSAHAQLSKHISADISGKAYVGAKANASGGVTIDPKNGTYVAEVKAGAFAGARASVEGSASFPGGKLGGSAEAWAGIGISAEGKVGLKNGKFSAKFSFGAALGIGGKLGFNVEIDFKAMKDKAVSIVKDAGKAVVNAAKDAVVGAAKGAANAVKGFFKSLF
jgi:hypothetical protein